MTNEFNNTADESAQIALSVSESLKLDGGRYDLAMQVATSEALRKRAIANVVASNGHSNQQLSFGGFSV